MLSYLRKITIVSFGFFLLILSGCSQKSTIPETTVAETADSVEEVVETMETPVITNETGVTEGYNYAYSDTAETDVLEEYVSSGASFIGSDYSSLLGFEENPALYSGTLDTKTIYFGYDLEQIPDAAKATLKAYVQMLKNSPYATIRLEGHADERGTRDYNVALSERRANAIKRFFMLNGVNAKQIQVVAYGEEKPAVSGSTELAWAKNRRVELVY